MGAPVLTETQRLRSSVVASLDESEMIKRPSPGQVIFIMEIRDHRRRLYRTQQPLPPPPARPDPGGALRVTEDVCALPGEYEVLAAIYDTASREYSIRHARLRVPQLSHDPLPGLWRGLPAIENGGRACYDRPLAISLTTNKRVQLDVIVNTPVDAGTGIRERFRVISEVGIPNGNGMATALNLEDRTLAAQAALGSIDARWLDELPRSNRNEVNVRMLGLDAETARFFVAQVQRRLNASVVGTHHVVIILSNPRPLRQNESARPTPPDLVPGTRIFYVLCDPPGRSWVCDLYFWMCPDPHATMVHIPVRTGDGDILFGPPRPPPNPTDALEPLIEPLHPERFDVSTPLEFRRALAKIMTEISNL